MYEPMFHKYMELYFPHIFLSYLIILTHNMSLLFLHHIHNLNLKEMYFRNYPNIYIKSISTFVLNTTLMIS